MKDYSYGKNRGLIKKLEEENKRQKVLYFMVMNGYCGQPEIDKKNPALESFLDENGVCPFDTL